MSDTLNTFCMADLQVANRACSWVIRVNNPTSLVPIGNAQWTGGGLKRTDVHMQKVVCYIFGD